VSYCCAANLLIPYPTQALSKYGMLEESNTDPNKEESMIERLRAVVEEAEKLPEEEQEALAALWEEVLEEARWEATLSEPRSLRALDAMVKRAKEQVARGEVYDTLRDNS
jgi:hypothetical protein